MKRAQPDNKSDCAQAKNREGALAAMRRAAKVAHRRTAARGDKVAIGQNGKVVWIDPILD